VCIASSLTACDKDKHVCQTIAFLAENDACTLAPTLNGFCSAELYCDAAVVDAGVVAGTCKKKTALGSQCKKTLECGLGNYCPTATSNCTNGKGGGAACSGGLECASLRCNPVADAGVDASAGSEVCDTIASLVKTEECLGP
jgi:hypothetical protein